MSAKAFLAALLAVTLAAGLIGYGAGLGMGGIGGGPLGLEGAVGPIVTFLLLVATVILLSLLVRHLARRACERLEAHPGADENAADNTEPRRPP